ncbi:MAG TPA: DegT/DnrJ/EryC1/StrS family aminotransferase [bacterium]|nr:DegT/DnrJ/EryC1/StrS family aminotransferase [bacterium]
MKRLIEPGTVSISDRQKELVNKVLDSTRLTYGPMTQRFEKEWAEMHQVRHALFCNSGTSALQVGIHALKDKYGWKDGDEILMPAVTFVASMNVVLHNNLKPVFVDIEPKYFSIDPNRIKQKINNRTKAIMVVHLLGHPALMDEIMNIAKQYNLKVIEDSCETVAAIFDGKPVGSFGDISCFSTYASHIVTTGVGGFACTNDDDLAVRIKGLYNHGRDGIYHSIDDDNSSKIDMIKSRFNFIHSGYSYRLTELEAALGLGHLDRIRPELIKRQENADQLITQLRSLEDDNLLTLPVVHSRATHSFMLFPIVLGATVDREKVLHYLEDNGVMTRFIMPLLNQPIVKKMFGDIEKNYVITEIVDRKGFLVGIHQGLNRDDIEYMARYIYKGVRKYAN